MATSAAPTQAFIPIKEIRDGVIIEKDGGLRAILLASSVNFSLKSDDEKSAILLQFQAFLNSLDFSVQIVVQSRRLDIRPYLALLEEQAKQQEIQLLKVQTHEYIEFVRSFTETTNIMTKNFFIIVSYTPATLNPVKAGGLSSLLGKKSNTEEKAANNASFEESRTQLEERLAVVEQGLTRSGVRLARLDTEAIIELFYKAFNPGETEKALVKH